MADEAEDLDALATAMNRSAERLQTLWFTFLAVTLYFAISAVTTTHRMLLLEEGQTLPILNVKLPLLSFYVIAPAFYVLFHAYMLMMLVLLARTAKTFEDALNRPGGMVESDRERYRMRIENAIFLQIIVGALRERSGANGFVLRTIALTTLAIAPVLLLLLFQLMFLPYHSEAITWWHRALTIIDVIAVWILWPSYRREWGERMLPRLRPLTGLVLRSSVASAVVLFSVLLADYPSGFTPGNGYFSQMNRALFGADAGNGYSTSVGMFPNRLWLASEDFVDDEKLKRLIVDNTDGDRSRPAYTVNLQNRDLRSANLTSTDLRRVNLQGALLQNANLNGAWLVEASLDNAQLQYARLNGAQLQGASLVGAQLQYAWFLYAQLQGVDFENARAEEASFYGAHLQAASFIRAKLTKVLFMKAQLQSAMFSIAQIDLATFDGAALEGVKFSASQLATRHYPEMLPEYDAYELRKSLVKIVCSQAGAPYIVRGLIRNRAALTVDQAPLIERLKSAVKAKPDEATDCPGARRLTDGEIAKLSELMTSTSPQ